MFKGFFLGTDLVNLDLAHWIMYNPIEMDYVYMHFLHIDASLCSIIYNKALACTTVHYILFMNVMCYRCSPIR